VTFYGGHISKSRLKEARKFLSRVGVRPTPLLWEATVRWAQRIGCSYLCRPLWPSPFEIASMYLFLLYASFQPRLPYRARRGDAVQDRYVPPPDLHNQQALPFTELP
jgi:hypothetical protein